MKQHKRESRKGQGGHKRRKCQMTFGLDWVEGGNQQWPDKSARGTCDSQLVKSSHKMLRLRKTKLLPQQVSDLGAFIFVVAMIPVRTTFKKIIIMFNDLFVKCLPPGDLSLGSACCQSGSFPRPAAGENGSTKRKGRGFFKSDCPHRLLVGPCTWPLASWWSSILPATLEVGVMRPGSKAP